MNVRPMQEQDIEAVISLFKENYGDDYAMPEFYDPQWVIKFGHCIIITVIL
jgi:hypothetical protein